MKTTPICWVPYYSIEINPFAGARPCCKFLGKSPYGENFLEDYYSEATNNWRKDSFESGVLPDSCNACKVDQTEYSYLEFSKNIYIKEGFPLPTQPKIKKILLALDNVCASSCIMCGPHFSTTIANMLHKNKITMFHRQQASDTDKFIPTKQLESIDFEKHLTDLEFLHFYGGEPLISPNLEKFLKNASIHCKKIKKISFSTGLKNVKESNLELFKKYLPNCTLSANVSIDGPFDLNYWIRGIDENEYRNKFNLLKTYSHISGFQITVGAYNFFAMPECIQTIEDLTADLPNRQELVLMASPIINPEVLSVKQVPDDIKVRATAKLSKYLENDCPSYARELIQTSINLTTEKSTVDWNNSIEYMEILPKFRNNTINFPFWIEKYLD
jgi:hypothetical protein